MEITIVEFKAFDKPCSQHFVDKTLAEVHEALTDRCNTYVATAVYHCDDAREVPLDVYTRFLNKNLQL